jgi:hypothetical protein
MNSSRSKIAFLALLAGLVALVLSVVVLADKVTGPLIRNYSGDGYATHYSHTGYGGYANITNISDLTSLQLAPGMVVSLASSNNWFLRTFDNSAWVRIWWPTNDVQGYLSGWTNTVAPLASPSFTSGVTIGGAITSTNLDQKFKTTASAVYTGRSADYGIDSTGATDAQAAIAYMVSQVAATSGPQRIIFAREPAHFQQLLSQLLQKVPDAESLYNGRNKGLIDHLILMSSSGNVDLTLSPSEFEFDPDSNALTYLRSLVKVSLSNCRILITYWSL